MRTLSELQLVTWLELEDAPGTVGKLSTSALRFRHLRKPSVLSQPSATKLDHSEGIPSRKIITGSPDTSNYRDYPSCHATHTPAKRGHHGPSVTLRETAKLSSEANARRAFKRRSGGSRTVNSASVRALRGEAMMEKTNKTQEKTTKNVTATSSRFVTE